MRWVAAIILALVFVILPVRWASADYDGPGSCLVVSNQTKEPITVSVRIPEGHSGTWTVYPASSPDGGWMLTDRNDSAIVSPDGHWYIWVNERVAPTSSWTWAYETDRNRSKGCNGSWVVSIPSP
jgi:hypothetical protein